MATVWMLGFVGDEKTILPVGLSGALMAGVDTTTVKLIEEPRLTTAGEGLDVNARLVLALLTTIFTPLEVEAA